MRRLRTYAGVFLCVSVRGVVYKGLYVSSPNFVARVYTQPDSLKPEDRTPLLCISALTVGRRAETTAHRPTTGRGERAAARTRPATPRRSGTVGADLPLTRVVVRGLAARVSSLSPPCVGVESAAVRGAAAAPPIIWEKQIKCQPQASFSIPFSVISVLFLR